MIFEYFRVTGAHEAVLGYYHLFRITLHDDDVQEFDTGWDEVLFSVRQVPSDDILGSLFMIRIRRSDQLKTGLALYEQEFEQFFHSRTIKS